MIVNPHVIADGHLALMNTETSFSPKLEFQIAQNEKGMEGFSDLPVHGYSIANGYSSDSQKKNHTLLNRSEDEESKEGSLAGDTNSLSKDANSSDSPPVDSSPTHQLNPAEGCNDQNDSGVNHLDVSLSCLQTGENEEPLIWERCNSGLTPKLTNINISIQNKSNRTDNNSHFLPSNPVSNSGGMILVNSPVSDVSHMDTAHVCSNSDVKLENIVSSMPSNFEEFSTDLYEPVNLHQEGAAETIAKSLNESTIKSVIGESNGSSPEGIVGKVDNSYQNFNSIESLTCPNAQSDLAHKDVLQNKYDSNDKLNSISMDSLCPEGGNKHILINFSSISTDENKDDLIFTEHHGLERKNSFNKLPVQDSVSTEFIPVEGNASDLIICRDSPSDVRGKSGSNLQVINIQDYTNLKVELSQYKSENEQMQHRLSNLKLELDSLKTQQPQLLSTIEQQEKQLKQINETARRQQDVDARSYAAFKQELELQNKVLKRECETMKHEREVSVMRYAKSEMDVIQLRKEVETCQKKLQDCIKERDHTQTTVKQLISDKNKFSQMYDTKCSELRVAHNEIDQLKSDLSAKNNKVKWTQNKLKEETDSHKETQSKLDTVIGTIQAAKNEAEQAKVDAQTSIKAFQESQENRAYVLDQQLKEEQAKIILLRADKEDLEKKLQQLTSKLQQLESEVKMLNERNIILTSELQSTEKEKLELDVKLNTMQQLMNKEVQENVELESQLAEMRNLRLELEKETKKAEALEDEATRLRTGNAELLIDMDSCRKRETETLEFTERLTAQNVKLQSDFSALQAKNEELEIEQSKVNSLKAELDKERTQRLEENRILARHVAEHSQRCEELSKQLAEQKSENVVLRRKNAATIRELTRELQQAKKLFAEHNSDGGGSGSNSLCQDSRTSSCASLTDTSQAPSSVPSSIHVEPDKQTLIERIVELQRRNAQYLERVEFLEEHNQEMTEELKKKTKIVQNFMLREPVGALSSNSMDNNKLFLKQPLQFTKETALSKKGYMASLYSSKIKDKNMTLEKSLEICQTLHSLLEDTILKNITLKENMDTLGEEIARLRNEQTKMGES